MGEGEVTLMVALLPLAAAMLVLQSNPYHALVLRGILGAIAALVYAVLGAADVALTEALVGTMLAITLYAVAVRSSLVMRLGVLKTVEAGPALAVPFLEQLRQQMAHYHVRLELVPYPTLEALGTALQAKEIHGSCVLCAATERYAIAKEDAANDAATESAAATKSRAIAEPFMTAEPSPDRSQSPALERSSPEAPAAPIASAQPEVEPAPEAHPAEVYQEVYQIVVRVQRLYDLLSTWLEQESLGAIATLSHLPVATAPVASSSVPHGSPTQEVKS
jgi:putative multicomponent Na+:H+ antiporter subunit B